MVGLGTFTTRIRTGMGEELTISNSQVLGAVTRNYSRAVKGTGFIVDTTVTIGYDTPWRQVNAMLVEAARRTPGVLADPPPHVFQVALVGLLSRIPAGLPGRARASRGRAPRS